MMFTFGRSKYSSKRLPVRESRHFVSECLDSTLFRRSSECIISMVNHRH